MRKLPCPRCLFFFMLLIFGTGSLSAQTTAVFPLYPGAVPNSTGGPDRESVNVEGPVTRIDRVSRPTLTVFRPENPNGMAVIICPGGGYRYLAFDKEGTRVAALMSQWGITAFVLKYRLPSDSDELDKSLAPLQDAQQAIRLVREQARNYQVDAHRIGIMGFSAGGHVAASAATHFDFRADPSSADSVSTRPDFAILLYPVISFDSSITHRGSRENLLGLHPTQAQVDFFSNEKQVTPETPPVFLVQAGDDHTVPVENSIRFYQACVRNKVPAEMHLYPHGGHGFGLHNKTSTDQWTDRLHNWLMGLLANAAK